MNSPLGLSAGLSLILLTSGCVVAIGGKETSQRHEVPKPSPVVVVPSTPADSAVLSEIDAASRLSLDANKVAALSNVAARPGLSPAAQAHLVNVGLRTLDLEASRMALLQTLIANPSFAPTTQEAIFRQLDRLELEANKAAIIQAIQQRPPTS